MGIRGDSFDTMFGGLQELRALSGGLQKHVVSHHTQIKGSVWFRTNGKGADSPENHTVQEGSLADLD
jgi:hypothetical protein